MNTKISTLSIKSIFHWFLAIGFTAAYISEDFDRNENVHYAFGLFVGALIMFRIIYGFVGPKWASYKVFLIGIKNQTASLVNLFKKGKAKYISNPLASIVMLCILIVGLLCSLSGFILYSIESNSLINLNLSENFVEEAHEILANLFLILIGIHVVGIIYDIIFLAKTKILLSILKVNKLAEKKSLKENIFQFTFSTLWLIVPFFAFYFGMSLPTENRSEKKEIQYEEKQDEYKEHDDD